MNHTLLNYERREEKSGIRQLLSEQMRRAAFHELFRGKRKPVSESVEGFRGKKINKVVEFRLMRRADFYSRCKAARRSFLFYRNSEVLPTTRRRRGLVH